MRIIDGHYFDLDPRKLAMSLLGKVIRHRYHPSGLIPQDRTTDETHCPGINQQCWLSARIIETEAYYLRERASHSSLGYSTKRSAMFMAPGTIYMYYARGRDSLNFSAAGEGNAVLIKSGIPFLDRLSPVFTLGIMQSLNPAKDGSIRPREKLCAGQTLLCRSLNLKVADWNQQRLKADRFYLDDTGYTPESIIQCRRLGIREDRDAHLPYRFIDSAYAGYCTSDPRRKRGSIEGRDFIYLNKDHP